MFERADWLKNLQDRHGYARHPMERAPDTRCPEATAALAAPLKPRHTRNAVNSQLQTLISKIATEDRNLLSDAVGIFAERHERDGFVRFDSISELQAAGCYIEFLREFGFQKRELELVSGDATPDSQYRRQWRLRLSETYVVIRPCPPGRNYGAKTSLSIRPKVQALAELKTGAAGFRFAMAMAFIVFGAIPVQATLTTPVSAV